MSGLADTISSVSFTAPLGFLVAVPFLALIVWQLAGRSRRGMVPLTDVEYLVERRRISGAGRRWLRAGLWAALAVALGALWSQPAYRSERPLFAGATQTAYKNFVLLLDVSRSMSVPLGQENRVSLPGQPAPPAADGGDGAGKPKVARYRAARAALMDFVGRLSGERIGLILFSTEPILARWPTVETGNRFWEVLEEEIGPGVDSQIQRFSSLTNIDKALKLAREVFARQDVRGDGAAILITDAEDDVQNMGVAARNLRKDGIRLYVIGVGISRKIAARLKREFAGDPGFRIFRVDSEREMREAYRLVGEVEALPRFRLNRRQYVTDLRWLLSLAVAGLAGALLAGLVLGAHTAPGPGRGPARGEEI